MGVLYYFSQCVMVVSKILTGLAISSPCCQVSLKVIVESLAFYARSTATLPLNFNPFY